MKRKSMLLMMALTVVTLGVPASRAPAQQVYSLNVVGYYNLTLVPGWNLVANQLIQTNFNANSVLPVGPVDGSLLYRFNPASQNYYDAGTYIAGLGWYPKSGNLNDSVLEMLPGEGFFIWAPQQWIATFVGEVAQGSLTNPLPANYSLKSSKTLQAGLLTTDLGFPPYPGDMVWRRCGHAVDALRAEFGGRSRLLPLSSTGAGDPGPRLDQEFHRAVCPEPAVRPTEHEPNRRRCDATTYQEPFLPRRECSACRHYQRGHDLQRSVFRGPRVLDDRRNGPDRRALAGAGAWECPRLLPAGRQPIGGNDEL
jgi:hypothetical protein